MAGLMGTLLSNGYTFIFLMALFGQLESVMNSQKHAVGTRLELFYERTVAMLTWREWWCCHFHKSLELVQDRGSYQHVRCYKCYTDFAIDHDKRTRTVWRLFNV